MGVFLEAYQAQDIHRGSVDTVGYLLANMGEQITFYIDYRVEDIVFANADNKITLAPLASSIDTLDNLSVITTEDGVGFENFRVGDTIVVHNTTGPTTNNYIVTEKLNDGAIRVNNTFAFTELGAESYVAITTPYLGHKYYYNFIENADGASFISKVDGETQLLKSNEGDSTNTTIPKTMLFNGILSYQIGSAQIIGQGTANQSQRFRIIHNTVITPFFLMDQLQDLFDSIAPDYYLDNNCLRHVFRLEITRTLNDPNPAQILQVDEILGNTGWMEENYNGGTNYFSISNKIVKRISDNVTIPSFQLDAVSEYQFNIDCVSPAVFANTNTRVIANFIYLPEEESQYQNNGRDLKTNFVYDTVFRNAGQATTTGANFGTSIQVITGCQVVFVSPTSITVKIRAELGSLAEQIITQGDFRRYMLWVTVESYNLTRATSDKVNLFIDRTEFFEDLDDTNIISATSTFIQHTGDDADTDGDGFLNAFPVDDVVVHTDFSMDYVDGEPILIKKVIPKIVIKKSGEDDIELESFTIDTSNSPLEAGLVPFISFEQDRVFKIPEDEIRKTITLNRRSDLDTGTVKHWVLNYPFMHRWEYWISLGILDNLPAGIFDTSEPLNGINNFWHRFTTITGWDIYFRTRFVIEKDGEELEQVIDVPYTSMDFASNTEWDNESIKSYTLADVELVSGADKFLQGFEDTKIVVSFEKVSGDFPDVADVAIVIWIEPKEMGGITDIRRASSLYELNTESWFKSIDASNKVIVTSPGAGIYEGTILVDYTKLPDNLEFTMYARIYDPSPLTPEEAKIMESGDLKLIESGDIKIIE